MTHLWRWLSIMPNGGLDKSRARVQDTGNVCADSCPVGLSASVGSPFHSEAAMDGQLMLLCISIGLALGFVVGFFFGGGFDA